MKTFYALCLSCLLAAPAQAITIDFDTDPDGTAVPAQTNIDTVYTSLGVTFSKGAGSGCDGNTTSAYANSDHPSDFGSLPNTISTCINSSSDIAENLTGGLIRATFSIDVISACIAVRPDNGSEFAVMRAYDITDTLIDIRTSTLGITEQLCVTGSAIRKVEFSGSGTHYARFDDFVFTPVATPTPTPSPLPTPSKPKVTVSGNSATITMKNYGAGASYSVTVNHPRAPVRTRSKTLSKRTTTFRNLRIGKWKATYSATVQDVNSGTSGPRSFKIE